MCIDLAGLNAVNDGLGHAAGDALLQALARRLQAVVREGELLLRVGGDEFTVLLPQVAGAADVAALAQRLVAVLGQPLDLGGGPVQVGASIGIALFPGHADVGDLLLRLADEAKGLAKARGKGMFTVHGEAPAEVVAVQVAAPAPRPAEALPA